VARVIVDEQLAAKGLEHDDENAERLGPIKVLVIDVERLPKEISAVHPDGGRYESLWALLRFEGRPRQFLKLPFAGEVLTDSELATHIDVAVTTGAGAAPAPGQSWPLISIVIPTTLKRLPSLLGCLESLEQLDYPRFEVLLVDNRPQQDGDAAEWFRRFGDVRVLTERRPGISAARNRGLTEARGEIVAFTDDDMVVDAGWLRTIAARFAAHPDEVCVTGLVLPRELETPAQIRLEQYYGGLGPRIYQPVSHRLAPSSRLPRMLGPASIEERDEQGRLLRTFSLYAAGALGTGGNMAFRTTVLRQAGGFDRSLGTGTPAMGGEELSMFAQLAWRGHALGFEPAALVHHAHYRDDESLRRQLEGCGVGFGAMAMALAADDPRHLGGMVATLPRAFRSLGLAYWRKLRTAPVEGTEEASSVPSLARVELRGMARAPLAYWRSRRMAKDLQT
jgi:Glycosyl transferase family 2